MNRIESIMTRPVTTIGMDRTLKDARRLLAERGFHHLVVLDGRRVVGVVSDRDIMSELSPFVGKPLAARTQDERTLRKKIHQIMSREPICVDEGCDIDDAARLMLSKGVGCLPVVSAISSDLRGLVTWRDLLAWSLEKIDGFKAKAAPETPVRTRLEDAA